MPPLPVKSDEKEHYPLINKPTNIFLPLLKITWQLKQSSSEITVEESGSSTILVRFEYVRFKAFLYQFLYGTVTQIPRFMKRILKVAVGGKPSLIALFCDINSSWR